MKPRDHTLDWKVNKVKPKNTPSVMSLRNCSASTGARMIETYSACMTMMLSKNAVTTPSVKASITVKVDSRNQVKGMAMTLPVQQSEVDQSTKEGNIE
jgi:hypothetical protein